MRYSRPCSCCCSRSRRLAHAGGHRALQELPQAARSRRAPISSRRSTTASGKLRAGVEGQLRVPAPGQVPLGLRQAGRPGDRRRRRARLDLRPRPEPGDGAQARRRRSAPRRRRCSPASTDVEKAFELTEAGATDGSSGWRRSRRSARPASSASAWASARPGSRRWSSSTTSARPRCCASRNLERNPKVDPGRVPLRAARRAPTS